MDQGTARNLAKRMCDEGTGAIYIATTVCAARGQYEQGPDANIWGVVCAGLPRPVLTTVPEDYAEVASQPDLIPWGSGTDDAVREP